MKIVIDNYVFNKTTKVITFSDYSQIKLEQIILVSNITRKLYLYLFGDPNLGGTVTNNQLTLGSIDTSAMADTDKLLIYYEDPNAEQLVKTKERLAGIDTGLEADRVLTALHRREDSFQTLPILINSATKELRPAPTGKSIFITDVVISHAGTQQATIVLQDGAGTPVPLERIYIPASVQPALPLRYNTPKICTKDTALNATTTNTSAEVYITVAGYELA